MFIRVPGRLQESPWEGEERAREWDADRSQDSLLQEWKSRSHNFTFVWWRLPLLDQPCDTFVISLFLAGHEAFSLSYRKGKSDRIAKERKACDSRTCKRESSTVIPSFSAVGWAKRMEGKITYVWMRQRSGNQKDEKEETAVASSSTNHPLLRSGDQLFYELPDRVPLQGNERKPHREHLWDTSFLANLLSVGLTFKLTSERKRHPLDKLASMKTKKQRDPQQACLSYESRVSGSVSPSACFPVFPVSLGCLLSSCGTFLPWDSCERRFDRRLVSLPKGALVKPVTAFPVSRTSSHFTSTTSRFQQAQAENKDTNKNTLVPKESVHDLLHEKDQGQVKISFLSFLGCLGLVHMWSW